MYRRDAPKHMYDTVICSHLKMWRCHNVNTSHCNIHQWLCHILTFIKVHVALLQPSMVLSHITTYIKVFVELWNTLMATSHCNIHRSSCHITKTINAYVILQRSSKFTSHCDDHQWLGLKLWLTMFDYCLPCFIIFNCGWPCLAMGWIIVDHVWLWFDHVRNMVDYCWMWVNHSCFWFKPFGSTI